MLRRNHKKLIFASSLIPFAMACNTVKEEGLEVKGSVSCKFQAEGKKIKLGTTLSTQLSCTIPKALQGKVLVIEYDKNLLEVAHDDKPVLNPGKLEVTLPKKSRFATKLDLKGISVGDVEFALKLQKFKKSFSAQVFGELFGELIEAKAFSKMEDASKKVYTYSPLRIDASTKLVSHTTQGACSNKVGSLLVSQDEFKTCDAVSVHKGDANDYLILPVKAWKANANYQIGIRETDKIRRVGLNSQPVTFATANDSVNELAYQELAVSSGLGVWDDKVYLSKDGYLWFYIKTPLNMPVSNYNGSACSGLIDYAGRLVQNKGKLTGKDFPMIQHAISKHKFSSDPRYIGAMESDGLRVYYIKDNRDILTGGRLSPHNYYACWMEPAKRS